MTGTAREFDPEALRVIGRLAWMKDGDEGHWFSAPSSNDQIVFREDGIYAHSLTGARIEMLEIHDRQGRYVVVPWEAGSDYQGWPKFSDLVEWGQELYSVLVGAGLELWSNDPNAIFQWQKRMLVVVERDRFVAMTRMEAARKIKSLEAEYRNAQREQNRQRKQELQNNRLMRKEQQQRKSAFRSTPEYQALFLQVYGKPLSEIGANDHRMMVHFAHALTEYRLSLLMEQSDAA